MEVKYTMICSSVKEGDESTIIHFENVEIVEMNGLVIGTNVLLSRVREAIAPGVSPVYDG